MIHDIFDMFYGISFDIWPHPSHLELRRSASSSLLVWSAKSRKSRWYGPLWVCIILFNLFTKKYRKWPILSVFNWFSFWDPFCWNCNWLLFCYPLSSNIIQRYVTVYLNWNFRWNFIYLRIFFLSYGIGVSIFSISFVRHIFL